MTSFALGDTPVTVAVKRMWWIGHLIACPDCGADDRWELSAEPTPDGRSRTATAQCGNGHRVAHPLIYPWLVHTVATWSKRPAPDPAPALAYLGHHPRTEMQLQLDRQLKEWKPQWISIDDSVATYHDWETPGPVDWDVEWPELVATRETLRQINEWSRNSSMSDTSFGWMGRFGTTEPDLTRIEIALFPSDIVEFVPGT